MIQQSLGQPAHRHGKHPRPLLPRGVTARAILIGLVLMPVNVYWVTVVEVRYYSLDGSCLPLFITPVFMLFVLALLNLLLIRFAPRLAFSQTELLVIYLMVVISETLAGHDMVQNLFGVIGHPFRFATPENQWEALFLRFVPSWLAVSDPTALRHFYEGGELWWRPENIGPFLLPLLAWGGYMLVLILVMLCINTLVRRHWTEHEHLAYPLIVLPLELTRGQESYRFFSNRLMWAGFAVAAAIDVVNGLHTWYPQVPYLRYVKLYELLQHFKSPHLLAMGSTRISMYPFAIGLAFFLPLDLSFSCWFFYVVAKIERVAASMMGWRQAGAPYLDQQAAGAWLALALVALIATRTHFAEVWRHLRGFETRLRDADEPMPYSWAVAGIVGGFTFLVIFSAQAGMSVPTVLLFLTIYYLLSIAMTRVRAELGTPHEIYFVNPHRIIVELVGVRNISPRDLTALSTTYWFNRCYRCHPMPCQLEGFKMAEYANINRRWLAMTMAVATVFAILFSYWANLSVTFREGASARCSGFKAWVGWETYNRLAAWLRNPTGPDYARIAAMGVGALIVAALKWLRFRYSALPLHPAGYALAISFAMDYFWFAFFVSWLIKLSIMRYWGQKAHRSGVWFFMGLISGDYFAGSIWAILGPALGRPNYKIFI
ncbi:MAG: hypothetical protein H5T86_07050 [Armatimonadetes bacterium]|nr:hypothetical protein [Armatimonadota bacterium]